ncbi:GNAT family N-acetyltransferase [Burkholderia thailandensis]|uniref:Acetyltransferase domain protein n=1 Tax=Burkholderia thailandensis TaxID=57975 RepID=A0AAW9CQE9_BURTH|nr:GNAT family N-acetyltransferase [Burkholderia thailandensis]AHI66492.1 acetyltransferase domain protein [Burkholderia thailandensis H0587]AIP66493.1 acetyltransferase [Burkholderia thailandensis]AOI54797.1 acetyltransferase [Burkholderia thailandensis]AOJ53768.1 acetyltransferase [Burkholderia thailandensis]AVR28092.1 GNAT family N-acetyltransferase [Burkholderia thailandensis]
MDRAHRESASPVETLLDGMIGKNAYFPRRIGGAMRVHALGDHAVVNSGLATDTFNLVISRAADGVQANAVAPIARDFDEAGLPAAWWTCRSGPDAAFSRALGDAGFVDDETSVGMLAELDALPCVEPPRGFRVRQISEAGDVARFGALICALFDPPDPFVDAFYLHVAALEIDTAEPLKLFLGEIDGRAVSTAALYLDAGTAHVFDISTAAHARRRGYARAITHFVLAHARDRLGADRAALQASPEGLNVYRRLGFRPVCEFRVYSNRAAVLERSHDQHPR